MGAAILDLALSRAEAPPRVNSEAVQGFVLDLENCWRNASILSNMRQYAVH